MTEKSSGLLVRVDIPDVKAQKCVVVDPNDTVWAAKQVVLDKLNQDLPKSPLNYSLYLPTGISGTGKLGKFLDDGRMLIDYTLHGHVPRLEMRYKQRDYSQQVSLTEKAIAKANTKANQRKLVEYINAGTAKKIEKLLEQGVDPNFLTEDGNTPLGLACGRHSHVQCIMPLLSGGAHIDFRGKDGLTPMHRAAIGGNSQAVKMLLSLGASPNYRDAKGLTPLYHTAIMGDDTGACEALLRHHAEMGVKDQGGWTELHQTSKYGHLSHANLFIRYGADINAQNLVGNTPLHVTASHGQLRCAMLLLKRGADKMKLNYSNQSPSQVAILCGHHKLATDMSDFSADQIEPVLQAPEYNANARRFDPKLFIEKKRVEVCPISPPVEALVGTLTQEWEDSYRETEDGTVLFAPGVAARRIGSVSGRPGSASSHASSHASTTPRRGSYSIDTESDQDNSSAGSTPVIQMRSHHPALATFQQQRERLYRAGPGKYMAVQDVEPQQPGDLALRKGMPVEGLHHESCVAHYSDSLTALCGGISDEEHYCTGSHNAILRSIVYIGKGGYWEGRSGGNQGWFPALAIKESGEQEEEVEHFEIPNITPDWEPKKEMSIDVKLTELTPTSNGSEKQSNIKEVVVQRGTKGFGFAMRGVKATKAMKFNPSPQVPALQYVGSVEVGGAADLAGLKTGDFIIEVNKYNVTYSTHDEVVNIVKKSGLTLSLKVITPMVKQKSVSTTIKEQMTPDSTPEQSRRSNYQNTLSAPMYTSGHSRSLEDIQESSPEMKETIIGGLGTHFKGSPVIARIQRSGWDSSQSQGEESPMSTGKYAFSYHIPPAQPFPASASSKIKSFPIPSPQKFEPAVSKGMNTQLAEVHQKSATLPSLPPRDYPSILETTNITDLGAVSDHADGEEEESEFALALRKTKEKMELSRLEAFGRPRAQTMPTTPVENENTATSTTALPDTEMVDSPPSPTEKTLSTFESQIRQANHDRTARLGLNQPRITKLVEGGEDRPSSPIYKNSIARAMSQKIDSLHITADSGSSDEFDSPNSSPSRGRLQMHDKKVLNGFGTNKAPPPLVKPKPFRRANTDMDIKLPSPRSPSGEDVSEVTTPPWNIKLKHTPKTERKFQQDTQREPDIGRGEDGNINWKSILKPTATTEPGRASPLLFETKSIEPRAEEAFSTGKRQMRQALPSPAGDAKSAVAKVFEDEKPNIESQEKQAGQFRPNIGEIPQSSTEGISLFDNTSSTQAALPKYYESKSRESFDEEFWVPIPETSTTKSDQDNPTMLTDDHLPPPLPPTDQGNFLVADLPPPAAFIIEGAETGESNTDDIILPPPMHEGDVILAQPSPPPPPLPDTSPPKIPPSLTAFEFPAVVTPSHTAMESRPNTTPSPTPSPLSPTSPSSKADTIPSPIPPPIFDTENPVTKDVVVIREEAKSKLPTDFQNIPDADIIDAPPPLPPEPPPPLDMDEPVDTTSQIHFMPLHTHDAVSHMAPPPVELVPPPETMSYQPQEHTKQMVDNFSPPVHMLSKSEESLPPQPAEQPPPRPPPPVIDDSPKELRKGKEQVQTSAKSPVSALAPDISSPPKEEFVTKSETAAEQKKEDRAVSSFKRKLVAEWEITDVCDWLRDIGLEEHVPMFEDNEIIGEHLKDLSKEDLKELGMKKLGHQKTFFAKFNQL